MSSLQQCLTTILIALAIAGSLVIGGLWWDSTKYEVAWETDNFYLRSETSYIDVGSQEIFPLHSRGFRRDQRRAYAHYGGGWPLPTPALLWGYAVLIPYYLILLTYLATLLLAWLLLMNRLARREALKAVSETP